jgi:hypothetical protein
MVSNAGAQISARTGAGISLSSILGKGSQVKIMD